MEKIPVLKMFASTEAEQRKRAEKINAKKIWDCGLIKYVWRKKEI